MTIAIDLTSVSYHLTGIERYAICITDKMIDIDKENNYVLFFFVMKFTQFLVKESMKKRIRAFHSSW